MGGDACADQANRTERLSDDALNGLIAFPAFRGFIIGDFVAQADGIRLKITIRQQERSIVAEAVGFPPAGPGNQRFKQSGIEIKDIGSNVFAELRIHLARILIDPTGADIHMLAV